MGTCECPFQGFAISASATVFVKSSAIADDEAVGVNPRGPEMVSVSAYKDGTLVAAAQLNIK